MSFLRPEAVAFLNRWRGVIVGAGLAGLGLYWAIWQSGALRLFGIALGALGAMLLVQAITRLRIRQPESGVGMVEITERQLVYFHPLRGATVSLDAVEQVEIRTIPNGGDRPDMFWVLHHEDGAPVIVPGGAQGADRLMDAIVALPRADYGQVIAASNAREKAVFIVWARTPPSPRTALPRG
jgi:hypothetical protein